MQAPAGHGQPWPWQALAMASPGPMAVPSQAPLATARPWLALAILSSGALVAGPPPLADPGWLLTGPAQLAGPGCPRLALATPAAELAGWLTMPSWRVSTRRAHTFQLRE